MNHERTGHTSSVLTNGKILVGGGSDNGLIRNTTELYDDLLTEKLGLV